MGYKQIAKSAAQRSASTGEDKIGLLVSTAAERAGRNGKHQPAGFGTIRSYDTGIDRVPEDQIALIHEGEKVIPADENPDNTVEQNAEETAKGKAAERVRDPGVQTIIPESTESLVSERDTTKDEAPTLGQGMAKAWLKRIGAPETTTSESSDTAAGLPKIATPAQDFHQEKSGGPLISGAPSTDDKSTRQDFASMDRKAKLAQYDQRIQQARDAGDETTADKLTVAKAQFQKANGWGTEGNHPGILGKIGHYASEVGNIAGDIVSPNIMALVPGTKLNRAMKENAAFNRIATDTEADQREATADTKGNAKVPKVLPGESNTAVTPDGTRYQRYEMPDGSTAWAQEGTVPRVAAPQATTGGYPQINLPTSASLPAGAVVGKPAGESKPETREQHLNRYAELKNQAAAPGAQLSDQDQKEFNTLKTELTVPKATIDSYNKQIDAALQAANVDKSLWSNYHVLAGSTAEEAKQAIADAKAFSGETYQQGTEGRKEDAETRAQDRKDKATQGYVELEDGSTVLASRYDQQQGVVSSGKYKGEKIVGNFEEAKPGQIASDRQAVRVLNDVQRNISVYKKALEDAKGTNAVPKADIDRMEEIIALNEQTGGAAFSADAKGISANNLAPVISAEIKAGAFDQAKKDLNLLSDKAKNLLTAYLRTAGSVVAYQKAVTGSARANELQLNLELANIPQPYWDNNSASGRLGAFQDNVSQVSNGYPKNLPGMPHPSTLKNTIEYPNAPKIGAVEEGHRYNGGDPQDPNSWTALEKAGK